MSALALDAVVQEVAEAFTEYEAALARNDVDALTAFFWDSPRVVRFGVADEQRGAEEVRRWRSTSPGVPPGRWLARTDVLPVGADAAVVTTRFGYGAGDATGRQTQVWARRPEGWRIVSAHVSEPLP
jgi:ketosteroid isomerase-like protein